MSHRNSARSTAQINQFALVARLVNGSAVALLSLVLVLLITNGGAG
jgi:hypothetical protein